jgi:hypothetical protein
MDPLLRELCESRVFPTTKSAEKMETQEVADLLYLYICAMRILASDEETEEFAKRYARTATQWGTYEKWRGNGNDLYVLIHLIKDRNHGLKKGHYPLDLPLLHRWLKEIAVRGIDEGSTHRLFARLDLGLRTRNDSMKAVRRIVAHWPETDHHQRELAMTRLLQLLRNRARNSELLGLLSKLAKHRDLKLDAVCDPETGFGCKDVKEGFSAKSFLASLVKG